jgi:hypothetical protein
LWTFFACNHFELNAAAFFELRAASVVSVNKNVFAAAFWG